MARRTNRSERFDLSNREYIYIHTHTCGRSLLNNPRDFVARKFESATREREGEGRRERDRTKVRTALMPEAREIFS